MPAINDTYVDLKYRGLPLGNRVRLTDVRPSTGYLELAEPMPVGTALTVATDEGPAFEVTVTEVRERLTPGMVITPVLTLNAKTWWEARVTLPEVSSVVVAPAIGIIRPKRNDAADDELVDDGRVTAAMAAAMPLEGSRATEMMAAAMPAEGSRVTEMMAAAMPAENSRDIKPVESGAPPRRSGRQRRKRL